MGYLPLSASRRVVFAAGAAALAALYWGLVARETPPPELNAAVPQRMTCAESESADYYFPEGRLYLDGVLDRQQRAALSIVLRAAKGQSLYCPADGDEAYRLTRVDAAPPLTVLARSSQGRASLEVIRLGGERWTWPPGDIALDSSRQLSAVEWQTLVETIERARIWSLPPVGVPPEGEGTVWLLEGRRDRVYTAVIRQFGDQEPIRELGPVFLRLAAITE